MGSSGGRENKEEGEVEVDSIWKELKLLGELPLSSENFDHDG